MDKIKWGNFLVVWKSSLIWRLWQWQPASTSRALFSFSWWKPAPCSRSTSWEGAESCNQNRHHHHRGKSFQITFSEGSGSLLPINFFHLVAAFDGKKEKKLFVLDQLFWRLRRIWRSTCRRPPRQAARASPGTGRTSSPPGRKPPQREPGDCDQFWIRLLLGLNAPHVQTKEKSGWLQNMTHMDFVDGHPVQSDSLRDGDRDRASHVVCHFWPRSRMSFLSEVLSQSNSRVDLRSSSQKGSHFTIVFLANRQTCTVSNFVQPSHYTQDGFLSTLKSIFLCMNLSQVVVHIYSES